MVDDVGINNLAGCTTADLGSVLRLGELNPSAVDLLSEAGYE